MQNIPKFRHAIRKGDVGLVKKCLKGGIDVNARLEKGRTPLILAVGCKRKEIVQLLLDFGANIEARNMFQTTNATASSETARRYGYGHTALTLAASLNDEPIVHLLVDNGANVNAQRFFSDSEMGIFTEEYRASDEFKRNKPKEKTALIYAVENKNFTSIKFLLENGADPNIQEWNEGRSALHMASDSPEIIKILLEYGADTEARTFGWGDYTPLMSAAIRDNCEAVKILLEHGADIEAVDSEGNTSAMCAAEWGAPNTLRLLLETSGNVNYRSPLGQSILFLGAKDGNESVIRTIIDHGFVDINAEYVNGDTEFMRIIDFCSLETIKLLIELGADIQAQDGRGKTVLGRTKADLPPNSMMGWLGQFVPIRYISRVHIAQFLFSQGATMSRADEEVLFIYVRDGLLDMLEVYLQNGANVRATNDEGLDLLTYAEQLGNHKACELLEKFS